MSPVRPRSDPGRTTSTGTTLLSGSLPGPIFKNMIISSPCYKLLNKKEVEVINT